MHLLIPCTQLFHLWLPRYLRQQFKKTLLVFLGLLSHSCVATITVEVVSFRIAKKELGVLLAYVLAMVGVGGVKERVV